MRLAQDEVLLSGAKIAFFVRVSVRLGPCHYFPRDGKFYVVFF